MKKVTALVFFTILLLLLTNTITDYAYSDGSFRGGGGGGYYHGGGKPPGGSGGHHDGDHHGGYWSGGVWIGPGWGWYGWNPWWGSPYYPYYYPYYYPFYPYYVQPAPEPKQEPQPSSPERLFVYPRLGQSEKQQADDQYQCHRWAVDKTGYDPTDLKPGKSEDKQKNSRLLDDYLRAMGACLDGRGYSVK